MKKLFLVTFLSAWAMLAQAQTQPPAAPKAEEAPTDLAGYAGTYKMDSFFEKTIVTLRDGALYGAVDDNGVNKLIKKEGADLFQSTSSYGTLFKFKRDPATQKIVGITLEVMGQEVSGKKQDN
jgi:hypothetical protein